MHFLVILNIYDNLYSLQSQSLRCSDFALAHKQKKKEAAEVREPFKFKQEGEFVAEFVLVW